MSVIDSTTATASAPVGTGKPPVPTRRRVARGARRFGQLLAVTYLTALTGLIFWSDAPMAVGWHPQLVLTGSMVPAVHPGDVVLTARVDPASIRPGNIVLGDDANRPGTTYLHRVVRRDKSGNMVTKGDANPSEDYPALTPTALRGRAQLVVPNVGRPVLWMRQGKWVPAGVVALGSLLACFLAFSAPLIQPAPTSAGSAKKSKKGSAATAVPAAIPAPRSAGETIEATDSATPPVADDRPAETSTSTESPV